MIGPGGAGKSTFCRALGEALGLPVIHLDELYWHPGWVRTPDDEWAAQQLTMSLEPTWIIDGNHGSTLDIRFSRADTVIFLDFPRRVTVRGIVMRQLRNGRAETQAAGCPNKLDSDFVQWVWKYPRESRPKVYSALQRHPHLQVIVVRSRKHLPAVIASLREPLAVS